MFCWPGDTLRDRSLMFLYECPASLRQCCCILVCSFGSLPFSSVYTSDYSLWAMHHDWFYSWFENVWFGLFVQAWFPYSGHVVACRPCHAYSLIDFTFAVSHKGTKNKCTWGGFHKELRLVLSRVRMNYSSYFETCHAFVISPRNSPKLGLVLTLCETDPRTIN